LHSLLFRFAGWNEWHRRHGIVDIYVPR
jgi:hypothetical protein